jgi:hypothetical protein
MLCDLRCALGVILFVLQVVVHHFLSIFDLAIRGQLMLQTMPVL